MKPRSTDLDTPTLVDRISAELLDHLIACRTCSAIFAGQQYSLRDTGCVESKRIASASIVNQQSRRPNPAIRHLAEEILDDYIFNRLALRDRQAVEDHLKGCAQCTKAAKEREILASWIRAAFNYQDHGVNTPSTPAALLSVEQYASTLTVCG